MKNTPSLLTLRQWSRLALLNFITIHLLKQGRKSDNANLLMDNLSPSACLYRGDHGCKCAAGAVIADDEYQRSMEGKNVVDQKNAKYQPSAPVVPDEHYSLISILQHIHDNSHVDDWPMRLNGIYRQYRLPRPLLLILKLQSETGHTHNVHPLDRA